ncbi:MAG: zf-HC2 domain-containing protein [Anaerolineales bacterium]|jgi:predicted anti-sigma-YlaC factor YlaD|nr:zf-HC2 domain-containing protein [Anaerolineales bacterium]
MSEHQQDCRAILASLNDYLEGSLPEDLCAELESHMRDCENCRVVVDTISKTIYLYQNSGRAVDVPDGARARLFHALKLDDFILPEK